jgi:WHEP-TRS domain/OB-fold nucleic acid binding domain
MNETTSSSLDELNQKIQAKGDEIRQLKADGTDKDALAPHIEELLALKAQLPSDGDNKNNNEKISEAPASKKPEDKKKEPEKELTESEIKLVRLAKVEAMREAQVEPFEYSFDVTKSAAQLTLDYDGKLEPGEEDENSDVAVAGRIMIRRVFGKLAFFSLQDESGTIQLQFDKKRLGEHFQVRKIHMLVNQMKWNLDCFVKEGN